MQQCGAVRKAPRRAGRSALLAAALRDPPGLYLPGADRSPGAGLRGAVPDAARILRRVSSPEARIEGIDARLADPLVPERARKAACFVMLLPPVGNMSNPFYSVHPRRNDRFVAAHPPLRRLFPETDFAEFVFTGHLLGVLAATCDARFAVIARALRPLWLERLRLHLGLLPPRGVMLHLPAPHRIPLPLDDVQALCGKGRRVLRADLARFNETAAALAGAMAALHAAAAARA